MSCIVKTNVEYEVRKSSSQNLSKYHFMGQTDTQSSETEQFLIQACKKPVKRYLEKGLQIFQGISKISNTCELFYAQ